MRKLLLTFICSVICVVAGKTANQLMVFNYTPDFVLYFIPTVYQGNSYTNCGAGIYFRNITLGNVSGYSTVQPGASLITSSDVTKPWTIFSTTFPDPNPTDGTWSLFRRMNGTSSYAALTGGGALGLANGITSSTPLHWAKMSAKVERIGSGYTEGANIAFPAFAGCTGLPDGWGQPVTSGLVYSISGTTTVDYFIVG